VDFYRGREKQSGAANIRLLGEDSFARDVRAGRIYESE
jgi:hypothetical protein